MPHGERLSDLPNSESLTQDADIGYEIPATSQKEAHSTDSASASNAAHGERSVPLSSSIEPDSRTRATPDATREAHGSSNDGDLDGQIRTKAYEIFLSRDGSSGDALADWLEAERAVRGSWSASGDSGRFDE